MGEKRFSGAPFGTQKARFDVSAVHPQSKMPGTYTEVPYCKKATSKINRQLGPGTYTIEIGDFTSRAIRLKSSGPNWKRAYESKQLSAIPHWLYRNQWEEKRQLEQQMGPGKYHLPDFIDEISSRAASIRGICDSRGSRLRGENKFLTSIPGPGTYGKGGVPMACLEEKNQQSLCTVGVMEAACPRSDYSHEGSGLAPGCYPQTSPIQELLEKKVSCRGPYSLYSGERIPRNKHALANTHLGPGKYEIKHFVQEFDGPHHRFQGRFTKLAQYPEPPTERIFCCTLSQCPRSKNEPVVGYYEIGRKRAQSAPCKSPFNSSDSRFSRASARKASSVGVGQYDILRWKRNQDVFASRNVFSSSLLRFPQDPDSERERLLRERVQPKHVFLVPHMHNFSVEAPC